MGITIIPKDDKYLQLKEVKKKKKPQTMTYHPHQLNPVKLFAKESFWKDWERHYFDLSLIKVFYQRAPQLSEDQEITICDGKSVIVGKRTAEDQAILIKGYRFKGIYSKEWVEKKGFIYVPQYQTKVVLDHKKHFLKRYKERGFDLRLIAYFISAAAQAKLGQRIKVISDNDILIGTRTTAHKAMLISGMVRGEIDWDDYVDRKIAV